MYDSCQMDFRRFILGRLDRQYLNYINGCLFIKYATLLYRVSFFGKAKHRFTKPDCIIFICLGLVYRTIQA